MLKFSIVGVAFPYADKLDQTKIRPVLCLTNSIGKFDEVIIAYITSKIPYEKLDSDLIIDKKDPEFENTGLNHKSAVRLHKLMTISKAEIIGVIGVLPGDLQVQALSKVTSLFSGNN
ncbi:MAG: type II toxin-antitoxin system PemK/MazF family toxin [bacterium]